MRKMIICTISIMLLSWIATIDAGIAAAEDFMPRKLEIEIPDEIYFNTITREIPVRVIGGDATVFLSVFTKDKRHEISYVGTDHLPWRTVNRIDTCVYISPPHHLTEGDHILVWEDFVSDNGPVRPGEYYYYLWGMDTVPKQLVARDVDVPSGGGIIQTRDRVGNPLDRPVLYPATDVYASGSDSVRITRSRWTIGNDPLFGGALEETWYYGAPNWAEKGPLALWPYQPDQFYTCGYDLAAGDRFENSIVGEMRRFQWVTGGEALWDLSWGEEGMVSFASEYPQDNVRDPGAVYIGEDLMLAGAGNQHGAYGYEIPVIDAMEGYIVTTIVPNQWWQPSPYKDESDVAVESMQIQEVNNEPRLLLGNHLESLFMILNPHDPDMDWLRYSTELWIPQQGTAPRGIPALDPEGFALLPGADGDGGAGLLAPDGSWMGILPLTGDERPRNMIIPVNYGSAYDGLYFDAYAPDSEPSGLWYRGNDSCRGVLRIEEEYMEPDIISPDGGETITGGSTYTIQATHTFHPWIKLFLKYSLDNGAVWTMIDSISAGDRVSYDWLVPNVTSDECLVRLEWWGYYRVKIADWIEYAQSEAPFSIVGTAEVEESEPQVFTVFPASPNPFNPSTAIEFILPERSQVRVTVFNTLGQQVEQLHDGVLGAGRHRVTWDAADFGPGLYFYRVETDAGVKEGKMMLVK